MRVPIKALVAKLPTDPFLRLVLLLPKGELCKYVPISPQAIVPIVGGVLIMLTCGFIYSFGWFCVNGVDCESFAGNLVPYIVSYQKYRTGDDGTEKWQVWVDGGMEGGKLLACVAFR